MTETMREKLARELRLFHRNSCYPGATGYELGRGVDAILSVLAEPTEGMVEAAARDLCAADGNDPDEECAPMGCDQWALYKTEARSAVAAAIRKAGEGER